MTELRKRMIECLQLRGLSARTQESYVRAVRQLAEHYHKSPDLITEEELRQYFLFLKNVKHYSRNTATIAICGIRTRQLLYHPHVHYIVTGGGLSADGRWRSSRKDFLVPVKALSLIFRAKFRDELKKTQLFAQVEQRVWRKDWVVHSEPVGSGAQAFQYLAPYIFRIALSNNRLRRLHEGLVTFSYKESASAQLQHCTITAAEFIRRFLQHVLPPRFIKVRYYGLLSPAQRQLLQQARQLLRATSSKIKSADLKPIQPLALPTCSQCRGPLTLLGPLAPRGRAP